MLAKPAQALTAYQQAERLSSGNREIEEKVKALKWQLRKQDSGKQKPPQEVRSCLMDAMHMPAVSRSVERNGVSRSIRFAERTEHLQSVSPTTLRYR